MKRARLFHRGREIWATVERGGATLLAPDGEPIAASEAQWLPPVTSGATIFALGLNYADHNAELGFAAKQAAPLIFLKGHATLVGHGGATPRPTDARQMHPECELVAVIGRPTRKVKRGQALDHVMGYTIANDYAVREYLENYYRPNARVKNRDATTPIGPWIVDAADIGDPQALSLTTRVNGVVAQHGSTADMIMDVAGLVEYLSDFMTLLPGDLILTGTPHGLHFVEPGDVIESEIEAIGTLRNQVVSAR
ncbi:MULTISPECIES: fumarylacetoacetate hydrolase family protein [unclassified Sphingomonas]|uniref:fumarylacetoacetate hydrolase family protein n=1 Tax=unclassified Sphingomonas TaxID=196159 RepID=UPI0006F1CD7F|nr:MULTISPECIES: fumarylacetoacetate hydrolase family protein [unclassified Sphingomonas]KQX19129.1 2-hydroxyhepta-2,4-diene-1,7-dioate isomerase [Sphingomonas sp. Root1294]KQY65330.1 2-hydroxyhepta-2,4-diene-1,7-dioate isomerase [Sphingomonas sp. Root50]KRB95375.1 2-hydroxyhepta-2,4-diene-1,7-dioate isomerase [Sphingomonas sp. Root720]